MGAIRMNLTPASSVSIEIGLTSGIHTLSRSSLPKQQHPDDIHNNKS